MNSAERTDTLVIVDNAEEYRQGYTRAVADFQRYLTYEKHRSPETIRAYISDITAFLAYCNRHGITDLSVLTREHMRGWLASFHLRKAAKSSMARRASCLRSFFAWAEEEELVGTNPATALATPAKDCYLPGVLSRDQIDFLSQSLAERLRRNPRDPRLLRLNAVTEILYATGMRISELTALNLSSIDRSNYTMRVIGKGNKERIVPFGIPAMQALDAWVRVGRSQWFPRDTAQPVDALFLGPRGRRANPRQIREDLTRLLATVENSTASGAHIFRHTAATHLVDGGADIRTIQELLGHTNLATTQIYTHVSVDKLAGSYAKAHPRA